LIRNDLIEFSGFSGISIDFPENQDIEQQGLTTNPIAIFNSILSARLICVLDFVFAETTLIEPSAWPTDCWSVQRSSLSITNPRVVANAHRQAPRKSNIAGVR
jgi:hypothetical protein